MQLCDWYMCVFLSWQKYSYVPRAVVGRVLREWWLSPARGAFRRSVHVLQKVTLKESSQPEIRSSQDDPRKIKIDYVCSGLFTQEPMLDTGYQTLARVIGIMVFEDLLKPGDLG